MHTSSSQIYRVIFLGNIWTALVKIFNQKKESSKHCDHSDCDMFIFSSPSFPLYFVRSSEEKCFLLFCEISRKSSPSVMRRAVKLLLQNFSFSSDPTSDLRVTTHILSRTNYLESYSSPSSHGPSPCLFGHLSDASHYALRNYFRYYTIIRLIFFKFRISTFVFQCLFISEIEVESWENMAGKTFNTHRILFGYFTKWSFQKDSGGRWQHGH